VGRRTRAAEAAARGAGSERQRAEKEGLSASTASSTASVAKIARVWQHVRGPREASARTAGARTFASTTHIRHKHRNGHTYKAYI